MWEGCKAFSVFYRTSGPARTRQLLSGRGLYKGTMGLIQGQAESGHSPNRLFPSLSSAIVAPPLGARTAPSRTALS